MRKFIKILSPLLILLFLSGCASKFYQVTPEVYREKVKVLGVLPILVDNQSTISHPQRQEILDLLQRASEDKYLRLSQELAATAGYRSVRPVIVDPLSEQRLLLERTIKSDKDGTYRSYQIDKEAVIDLARSSAVDGLLLVILNGVENKKKGWERFGPRYLEAVFNEIQATTLVLGATGDVLWERPGASGPPFADLQYAGFDEAFYNRTDQVPLRFITVDGFSRALQEQEKGLFDKETYPVLYRNLFDTLNEALAVGKLWRN